ncbi:MAG: uridine diphosphate-N-acetylglucosamine-binding protein YvcK [Erysipelothrix sp.]|nr:uridine diphosphate-N-acetylglucosamine-binding protein YvcK [Erysipelothrix sp.]
MKKKVVVIGGGTGQATLLRGLKLINNIHLTAIVTVADDGGSTGRLRRAFHIPAMGDIRNVMISMAESETMLSKLMDYRFEGTPENEIYGHNLGNLILTALTDRSGNFMEAISTISKVLNVKGDIVPSSLQVITLFAEMMDGTIVRGESNIPKNGNRINRVFYQDKVRASRQAIEAIKSADLIIYGVGSLYTSICPNLIIEDIAHALQTTKAKKIYVCNAMTQPGETDFYSMEEHVDAIVRHSDSAVDLVIKANDSLPPDVVERYREMGSLVVDMAEVEHSYPVLLCSLLDFTNGLVRHDPLKVKELIETILAQE